MSFHLILGPMKSCKSTQLASEVHRLQSIGQSVLIVNHCLDTRFGNHALRTRDGVCISSLMEDTLLHLLKTDDYATAQCIIIEESQFFADHDICKFILHACDRDGKKVVAAGLQGDRHRKPFKTISALIPIADHITILRGLCQECHDGTAGAFTKEVSPAADGNDAQIHIGDAEYACVCRKHYLAHPPSMESHL